MREENEGNASAQDGAGKNIVLCFHGVGQHRNVFSKLAKTEGLNVLSHDLPFHGALADMEQFEPPIKSEWADAVLDQVGRPGFFSLLGFSMGAKAALAVYEQCPERVGQLVLLAPEGIHSHWVYRAATATGLGRAAFARVMKHGGFLARLARALPWGKEFAKLLANENERRRVYLTWLFFRRFSFPGLAALLQKHQTPLTILTGRDDKICKTAHMAAFCRDLPNAKVIELPCGHQAVLGHFMKMADSILTG